MKIGNTDIRTPSEDRYSYDLDWRAQIAHALVEQKIHHRCSIAVDPMIRLMVQALKGTGRRNPTSDHIRVVIQLHQHREIKLFVEAALLTRASNDRIAKDIDADPEVIRLFESLYFNVREKDGAPRNMAVMAISMHLDQDAEENPIKHMFYSAAIRGGYSMLQQMLSMHQSDQNSVAITASALVDRELNRRLLQGELTTSDLIRLRSVQIADERMLHETGQRGSSYSEGMELVKNLLQAMAPMVLDAASNPDDHNSADRMREAENRITNTSIQDAGPVAGHDEINAMLKAKYSKVTAP